MVFAPVLSRLHERFDDLDHDTKKKILRATASIAGVVVTFKVSAYIYNRVSARRIRDRKLNQVKTTKGKLLQKLVGLKEPIDNRDVLTRLSYEELRDGLRSNDLTAIAVLEAYQAKALDVDRNLNCITDVVYDADVTALYLDSLPQEKRGRLHGIPLSVKECVSLADYDSYIGCISRCFNPEKHTASVVEALTDQGMVPFVHTNMSQGGMSIACNNPLFGETLNPHDRKRTSGGSSGGEGALIGAKGSIVGIGNDVGGSIRVPASYCGIYGLKPTSERVGNNNMPKWKHDLTPISYTVTSGPLSSDFDLLVETTKVLFSPALFDLDDSIPRLHFDTDAFESETPMTIGIYKSFSDDACFEVVPAIKRGLDLAIMTLECKGHKVVRWEPPRIRYACSLLTRCFSADGGVGLKILAREECILTSSLKKMCHISGLPPKMKMILSGLLWLSSPMISRQIRAGMGANTARDVLLLMDEAKLYKEEVSKSWEDAGLDGVICPVLPFTAPLIGDTDDIMLGLLYCNMYNFLDYPAGVVPITKVMEEDIIALKTTYPRNNMFYRKIINTQAGSVGMPVSIQCVAKQWRDEKALRLMKEVKSNL